MERNTSRPWFGPKRVGVGLRPQTWQGWTVTLAFVALIIATGIIGSH